jgi:hypothetical protein
MQLLQGHHAGQQGKHPRQAHNIQIHSNLFEHFVKVVHLLSQELAHSVYVDVTFLELCLGAGVPNRYMLRTLRMRFLKMAKLLISSLTW